MPENTNKVIQLKDAEGNDVSPVVNVGSIYDKNGQKVDNLLSYTVAGTDVPVPEIEDISINLENALQDAIDAINSQVENTLDDINLALNNVGDLYVWRKTITTSDKIEASYKLSETTTSGNFYRFQQNVTQNDVTTYILYANSIVVNDDGTIGLNSAESLVANRDMSGNTINTWNSLKGKFISITTAGTGCNFPVNSVWFVPQTATITAGDYSGSVNFKVHTTSATGLQRVIATAAIPAGTTITYPVSVNQNAYTEGTSGNTTYEYLGKLGEGHCKTQTISYIGTGTYGSSSKVRVTFDFEPKLIFICGSLGTGTGGGYHIKNGVFPIPNGITTVSYHVGSSSTPSLIVSWSGKTVSWYGTGSSGIYQANNAGETYYVIGIG